MKDQDDKIEVFIASLGEKALLSAFRLAAELRKRHRVWLEFDQRKLDRQLGTAAKLGARFTVIIGDDEIARGVVRLKEMVSGEQIEVKADQVTIWLEARLGGE
jgi:histidyl-tRNA synthetase